MSSAGPETNPPEASSAEGQTAELSPAEAAKKLGNDAFLAKDYRKAIEHYSEAIKIDPENAVFYSNRSACYSFLKEWPQAFEDALTCVSKDPKFLKGYFRLASAQAELQRFDDAETTLRAALAIDPENEIAHKQLKALRVKKQAAVNAKKGGAKKPVKQLDEAQMKEFMELQEQLQNYNRDLRAVKLRLASLQREQRVNSVTSQNIQGLEPDVPLFRSVGKAFFAASRQEVEGRLEQEIGELTKAQRDLTDRQEYLERRIASNTANIQELIK